MSPSKIFNGVSFWKINNTIKWKYRNNIWKFVHMIYSIKSLGLIKVNFDKYYLF